MKIAVIGSGISGLSAAYYLSKKHKVDLFEKNNHFGGHSYTLDLNLNNKKTAVIPHGINEIFNLPKKKVFTSSKEQSKKNSYRFIYVSSVDMYKHQWNVVKAIGILKNNPLSKLPSPNSDAETSVIVANAPTENPLSKVLLTSIVAPSSFAKYLPIWRDIS